MVERGRFPCRTAMALATILTEARGMCILTCMATNTVLGDFLLQIAAAMAVLTVHMSVCALQGKTSFPGMVKLLCLPAGGRVTVVALGSTAAAMNIIRCVTRNTSARSVFVVLAQMATGARHIDMPIMQRKGGRIVIELDRSPVTRVVTSSAVATEPSRVWLLVLMAVDTGRGGLAIGLAGPVTAGAVQERVRPLQRKLRQAVIELPRIQFDDIAVAAQVFRMTGTTLRGADAGQLAVQMRLRVDVGGDLLVTIEAQPCLSGAVAAVMALRALLLVLLVRVGELTGHQQRFRIDRDSALRRRQTGNQHNQKQRTMDTSQHGRAGQSVDVDRNHVNYSCNEHDQDQRHVQRVPDRKETLVGLEARDLARGGQAIVHKLKCRRAQLLALRRNLRRLRCSCPQGAPDVCMQAPPRLPDEETDVQYPSNGQ